MTKEEVILLMKSSLSEREWDVNCEEVKRKCGGDYPSFWFATFVVSGLFHEIQMNWSFRGKNEQTKEKK